MKKVMPVLLVILLLLLGLGLLFYPDIASWTNARIQNEVLQTYDENVALMEAEYIANHFMRADEYNLALNGGQIEDPFVQGSGAVLPPAYYLETLNVDGVMGRIEIPKLNIDLPVFHTTFPDVLYRGVGHIEGTSFPVGGVGTHSVLTGHSGLAQARMFTDLLRRYSPTTGENFQRGIQIGDVFIISVLDRRLAYEVDSIIEVEPHEIETLRIDQTADFVTLVTCTPFAINSHRLLVRGARIPYVPEEIAAIEPIEIVPIDWRMVIIAGFVLLFLLFLLIYKIRESSKERKQERELIRSLQEEWRNR